MSKSYVFAVPVEYGRMRLPLLEVVVAGCTRDAEALVVQQCGVDVKVAGGPWPLGDAHDPTPRIIRYDGISKPE